MKQNKIFSFIVFMLLITTVFGTITTVKADPRKPQVSALDPIDIGTTNATLRGHIDDDGEEPCQIQFEIREKGETNSWVLSNWHGTYYSNDIFSEVAYNLKPGTTYEFLACALNSQGEAISQLKEFTTLTDEKLWTLMAYLDGGGNLEQYLIEDFEEMAEVGSNEDVNVVVQLDRGPGNDDSYGNWNITHRFFIEKDMEPTEDNAITDWGDGNGGRKVSMADKNSLIDFCNWAKSNYPAENYTLIIASHGTGYRGILSWTTVEINDIFSKINGGVDLLVFQACHMAAIEIADAVYPYVDYMVASEQLLLVWCLEYNNLLNNLQNSPSISPKSLSIEFIEKSFFGGYTKSAIDISKIPTINSKLTEFSNDLRNILDNKWKKITDASQNAQSFMGGRWRSCDLYDFARLIKEDIPEMAQSADSLMNSIKSAVLAEKHIPGDGYLGANGLTIYAPMGQSMVTEADWYASNENLYAEKTTWDDFLTEYYNYENKPPNKPSKPSGPTSGKTGETQTYSSSTTDLEEEEIHYWFEWGDGTNTGWLGPYSSGEEISESHSWSSKGDYKIKVKAKDSSRQQESEWSEELTLTISKAKVFPIQRIFERLIQWQFFEKLFNILEKNC